MLEIYTVLFARNIYLVEDLKAGIYYLRASLSLSFEGGMKNE
jgi:hypothetical protein